MNPYDWNRQAPAVEIPRSETGPVIELLRRGNGGVLLAGRGMGKSIFLQQIQRSLERFSDVRTILFPEPPSEPTVKACFEELARGLDVSLSGARRARDLVEAYRKREGASNLVLLFDEFDRYARVSHGITDVPPGRDFFNSLESMRRTFRGVGILAAGSIGVFIFRDVLGSSFLSRADKVRIQPFNRSEIHTLARPFSDRGEPLTTETLESLHLASGGNPALATYGLETLWERSSPSERAVTEAFAEFQDRNSEFLRDFQLSFADPKLSDAPQRVWDLIQRSDGRVSRDAIQEACGTPGQLLRLDVADVLDLLEASGLIRITGSVRADPVIVHPINSILSLPRVPAPSSRFQEQFRRDLSTLLFRLHVSSADFFRPGSGGRRKQLVPEAVFSAFLALGFDLLGWQVDREAQRGAGRTDIQLRRAETPEVAIIEMKIWGRNDYRRAHHQVESYWTADTSAGAVVMVTDAEIEEWSERYRRECLTDCEAPDALAEHTGSPIRARLTASSRTTDGMRVEVDHFLLRLPRGH